MFVLKKKYKELEKRVADLEVQVQSQQENNIDVIAENMASKINQRLKEELQKEQRKAIFC